MDDREVLDHIERLVDEEHHLLQAQAEDEGLDEARHGRLREVEVALDQCWDLLRQRRARREAGLNPDDAVVRPPNVVEGYLE
jgi:Protein of unknown function (DUF2630)